MATATAQLKARVDELLQAWVNFHLKQTVHAPDLPQEPDPVPEPKGDTRRTQPRAPELKIVLLGVHPPGTYQDDPDDLTEKNGRWAQKLVNEYVYDSDLVDALQKTYPKFTFVPLDEWIDADQLHIPADANVVLVNFLQFAYIEPEDAAAYAGRVQALITKLFSPSYPNLQAAIFPIPWKDNAKNTVHAFEELETAPGPESTTKTFLTLREATEQNALFAKIVDENDGIQTEDTDAIESALENIGRRPRAIVDSSPGPLEIDLTNEAPVSFVLWERSSAPPE